MYCGQCGNEIKYGASFCGNCGFPINAPPPNLVYPLSTISFQTAIKLCFNNYFHFKGRSRRSEYWWFALFIFAINLIGLIPLVGGIVAFVGFLATIIPQIAVTTRRLHDTGRSGWWQLLFVPLIFVTLVLFLGSIILSLFLLSEEIEWINIGIFIGSFICLALSTGLLITWIFWLTRPGDTGANKYGDDPRQVSKTTNQLGH